MEREDFWYNPEARSAGAIPSGAKAGQYLFLSAQTSVNLESGKIIRDFVDLSPEVSEKLSTNSHLVDAHYGPIMAQTWTIYQNISAILNKQGASLSDIIQQRIFLRDGRDTGWMEKVMLSFFPGEKPTTLIMGVPSQGLHEDIRVWVDVIALLPEDGGLRKETICLEELEKVTSPYPQAVKVGQFLFFMGLTGINPITGRPVSTLEELKSEARAVYLEGKFDNFTSEPARCQYWLAFMGHLEKIMKSQKATLNDLLVLEGFSRSGMKDECDREYLAKKTWGEPQNAPLRFHFGNSCLSAISNVAAIWGGVALLPGRHQKEMAFYGKRETVALHPCVTKAGPFAFGGGVGYNVPKQGSFTSFSDLADDVARNGRFLVQSRVDSNHPITTKAWHIYHIAFTRAHVKPSQVLHQTVYLKNVSEWPAVENIARIVFGGNLPPTTIIPVDDIAFYWKYRMTVPEAIGGEMLEMMFRYVTE
jgi:enamine deaminase RidA (YjgF/YER057c/UK114 family)